MISRHAPAKLNLFLHITGRRDDGYHLLESLFAFTRRGDVVSAEESESFSLEVTGPFAPSLAASSPADNLVSKAVEMLAEHAGQRPQVKVRLEKNLPIAAGIGGGSADAAATLLALNDIWHLDMPIKELASAAIRLGADVPACLYGSPLMVRGIGENIERQSLAQPYHVVLVNPGVPVSTPDVFKAYRNSQIPFQSNVNSLKGAASLRWLCEETENSLTDAAIGISSEIAEVLAWLNSQKGTLLARMSGSGATCFALFEDQHDAVRAENKLKETRPNWWVMRDHLVAS